MQLTSIPNEYIIVSHSHGSAPTNNKKRTKMPKNVTQ